MQDVPATITLDVAVTLDDQLRFTEWMLDRPALRWKRLAIRVAVIVLAPMLGLVLGVAIATVQDGTAFGPAVGDLLHDRNMVGVMASVSGLLAVLFGLQRLLRRPLLRRRLRRLLRERAGINPADPSLTETARISLGPDGFMSETTAVTVKAGWASVKGLDDEGRILVLKTGRWSGYLIPKRYMSAADLTNLTNMVKAHVAPAP